ncbi:MAG: aspartate kinase [Clostridia bacterium]|nr:aspartate kinase [Clostridia bacterium]MDN5323273.1 aspartate kinase [Clostridia bacterium]
MKIIVQKFGGSSLTTREKRMQAADKVIAARREGYSCVVVVSAMGRTGDPYATDTLINLAKEAYKDINPRELDLLLNCGEIISAVVLCQVFTSQGFEATVLTGAQAGIITDKSFTEARILKVNPDKIIKNLQENKIVIVTGFQGVTEDGDLTTLGRGGSDTTASALGVALNAEFVEIFTDVDGIKTADPRIVKDAKTLDVITYNEICQLAQQGAKVIHPRAVEIAMQKNIPLRVRSTFEDSPGTLVTNYGESYNTVEICTDRLLTGITHVPNITQLKIFINRSENAKGLELKIFRAMALSNISIDFINVHPDQVIFTVKDDNAEKAIKIIENLGLEVQVLPGCAKVSAVGANMAGVPGVMARIVEALTEENIKILQTADSHTTIWCLVKKEDMEKAVIALHKKFNLS